MSIKAIGFDLDYTLLVPRRDRAEILREATDRVDAPRIEREEYLDAHEHHLLGQTREPIFEKILERKDPTVAADELANTYRLLVNDSLELVPGCKELLSTIREQYHIGVLTNGPPQTQREKLSLFDLQELFDIIVISGEINASKPNNTAFKTLSREFGVPPNKSVFVGDEITADIEGALEAGFHVVQVCYPSGPLPDDRATAHLERANLTKELPEILRSLDT